MLRIATVIATTALFGVACVPVDGKPIAAGSPVTTTPAAVVEEEIIPPDPEDFYIGVNVIERQCYGSAGCNVRFKIDPRYNGPTLPETATFTVVFEVVGCDDGTVASFDIRGDKWRQDGLDWDYCSSPTGQLSARVLQVVE
ncbi:hypothetical protein LITTLEE_57 [Mycobacterium phage LittleE]|uniref:Lipoprotein n=4 Tax=Omegavirus TaxID=1623292 RepID=Q854K5_BPMOM|nr:gp59 [Mycobacterium phage Omega]YP_009011953.1 hypothetical protein CM09_gp054 [Mycobacterium phage Courthouse]YP_009205184.1 hypothetical protein AVT17_gp054 [Mycobacterium phage Ariel]YP_009213271.1 hypothetical protein AVV70_gp054 [Mycobacterium phage MiaZeal]YP_009636968.1 hypothetical protein FGG27_gp057 [Mycobacterium phage LittleE]ASD50689.1 hypothetical protein PORCELAIN_53 [Mycobacterium phage Porcelain]ASD53448.1 hypothetical protein PBI_LUCKY2013_55 [Mycobacterium phage Lucky201